MSPAADQGCRRAARLLSEQRERKLGAAEQISLRVHLLQCTGCLRYSRQLGVLDQAMRRWRDGDQPSD